MVSSCAIQMTTALAGPSRLITVKERETTGNNGYQRDANPQLRHNLSPLTCTFAPDS